MPLWHACLCYFVVKGIKYDAISIVLVSCDMWHNETKEHTFLDPKQVLKFDTGGVEFSKIRSNTDLRETAFLSRKREMVDNT